MFWIKRNESQFESVWLDRSQWWLLNPEPGKGREGEDNSDEIRALRQVLAQRMSEFVTNMFQYDVRDHSKWSNVFWDPAFEASTIRWTPLTEFFEAGLLKPLQYVLTLLIHWWVHWWTGPVYCCASMLPFSAAQVLEKWMTAANLFSSPTMWFIVRTPQVCTRARAKIEPQEASPEHLAVSVVGPDTDSWPRLDPPGPEPWVGRGTLTRQLPGKKKSRTWYIGKAQYPERPGYLGRTAL